LGQERTSLTLTVDEDSGSDSSLCEM